MMSLQFPLQDEKHDTHQNLTSVSSLSSLFFSNKNHFKEKNQIISYRQYIMEMNIF